MNLSQIKVDKPAKIISLNLHGKVLKRVTELGFYEGLNIMVYAISPKNKVYLIDFGGDLVALSREICDKIEVNYV